MDRRIKRLQKEVKECYNEGLHVDFPNGEGDYNELILTFDGPKDTPYEGGHFKVRFELPPEYPFQPPTAKFVTKVYHPNVSSSTGYICIDILKSSWTPMFTLRSISVSLQALLSTPEPRDPQDAVVAQVYLNDFKQFEKTAREWTVKYASANPAPEDEMVDADGPADSFDLSVRSSAATRQIELDDIIRFRPFCGDDSRILETLDMLNYRGNNRRNVESDVVDMLLAQP